jgi:hypothetical protein
MMMYACTCGLWHSLATATRCDDGVPTTDSLDLLVDLVVEASSEVGFPLDEWQVEYLRGSAWLTPSRTPAHPIHAPSRGRSLDRLPRAHHVGGSP